MYLIDTSIWIDFFKEKNTIPVKNFLEILEKKIPFGITGIIYQEILQGAASQTDLEKLIEYLSTQKFYHPKNSIITYQEAAKIYYECRKKGLTIRSTVDCFIAQIAIENNLTILHNDKDYEKIKLVVSDLQIVRLPNLQLA